MRKYDEEKVIPGHYGENMSNESINGISCSGYGTIKDMLQEACRKYADRIACRIDGKELTYAELNERALREANALKRLTEDAYALREPEENADGWKKRRNAPVILQEGHSLNEIVSVLACIYEGRAYVPINPAIPSKRLLDIKEKIYSAVNSLEDIAYVIFTSGSTGEPKGVPVSYENLTCFAEWIRTIPPLDTFEGVRVLNQADLSFDLSVTDLFYALCNGHTWVAGGSALWDRSSISELFLKEKINVAVMTPSAIKLCLLEDRFNTGCLPELKCVYFCGERLEKKTARKLWERFPELTILNAYGPTEATSAVCAVRITKAMPDAEEELPVGDVSNAAVQIEIIDDEIVLKGASVFGGYLGKAAGKSIGCGEHPVEHVYHTGDLGYIRNGLLYFSGRKDSQIKYKGYRIELYDIENNLNQIPGIRESAVTVLKNKDGAIKAIQAYCVPENTGENSNGREADKDDSLRNQKIDSDYVKNALREMVPEYMVPKTIKIVAALPMNANGKTDRKALELKND